MKAGLAIGLVVITLGVMPAWATSSARISLKETAIVTERQTVLGDIAAIQAGDADTVERLAAIPIAMAPKPGYSDRITREEVKRCVRARVPAMRDMLTWEGAAAVTVETSGTVVEGGRLRALALQEVTRALSPRYERVEAHAAPLADVMVMPGAATLKARPVDVTHGITHSVPVWIDIFVDGTFARAVDVPVEVEATATVRVARTDLMIDHMPQPTDFETRRVDVARLGSDVVMAGKDLAGMRIRRPVRAGAVLVSEDLQERPAVVRGEMVTLRLAANAVRVESRAIALGEGAVGDSVWVRRESSGASLRTQVVGPGTVEVIAQ